MGELKKNPAEEKGWLNDGVGDGSCTSCMVMLAHIGVLLESADVDVTLGLDGSTRQDSTGAGTAGEGVDCDQMPAPAGELGSSGGWRTTSTILGGGGSRGLFSRLMMLFLTYSLLPQSSSPAPSSSKPSRAETWVRKTNLLIAWTNSSCNFFAC
jgi:hypothetical protein